MRIIVHKGGKGSGDFGHAGRPGLVGGSGDRETLPLTKGNVSSVIEWTTSRYNEHKKSEVVQSAMNILKGTETTIEWGTPEELRKEILVDKYRRKMFGDNPEITAIEPLIGKPRSKIKVVRRTYSSGTYATGYGVQLGGDYLINGEEGYIARGYFSGEDPWYLDEKQRTYFK